MSELLHTQLERSAERHPDRIAVKSGASGLTYEQLEAAANQLAHTLTATGTGPGDRVGLLLDKSLEAVTAIYGVMKSGAAYVPLDPAAPPARIAHIMADCRLETVVSGAKQADVWDEVIELGAPLSSVIAADIDDAPSRGRQVDVIGRPAISSQPTERLERQVTPADLAVILYTSGSTGSPKGVMLSHGNVMAFAAWGATEFELTADDRLSQLAPLHFDLSTFDLFAAARVGAAVHLASRQTTVFPMEIRRLLESERITVTYAVPSILTMLTERTGLQRGDLPGLRAVLFAGEVFPTKYLSRLMNLLPHAEFANLFGPTETNVCTFYRVPEPPPPDGPPVLIGKPIAGVSTSVVKDDGGLAAPGEAGELWVRGPTVMQGYWPQRTPVGEDDAALYRTGDLVRETLSGDYEFIGRRDSQIKSRGYRIELGDIEATLLAHPDIHECAVIPVPDDLITNRITAYVVSSGGVTPEVIAAFAAQRLPKYMIPEAFEFSDALPKTSTGKINRQQLAAAAMEVD